VIRGDDHLNNAFRQQQIYDALGWGLPGFAHLPLIHGPDGAKLSKRHGALGVEAYRDLGYLPEALRNYLLRLGWSHGDNEIIATEQAIEWFEVVAVGRAPARFDFAKLDNLNGHYIRVAGDDRLAALVAERLEKTLGHPLSETVRGRLRRAMPELKLRPKTLVELTANACFLVAPRPIRPDEKAARLLTPEARQLLAELLPGLDRAEWRPEALESEIRSFAAQKGTKLGAVAQPLRAALTGSVASPGIFEVMQVLGRDETLGRIADAAAAGSTPNAGIC
jgi:glutamyl-tRNA synthetase